MAIVYIICILIVSAICAATAGYMAIHNTDGWGWFLFAAVLLAGGISIKRSHGDDKAEK